MIGRAALTLIVAVAVCVAVGGCDEGRCADESCGGPPAGGGEASLPLVSGRDLTCGVGSRRVYEAEGAFPHPESCAWSPLAQNPGGLAPGRWYCTVTAYTSDLQAFDGFGWIAQFLRDGQAYYPDGGVETGAGFNVNTAWDRLCGGNYQLGNPLGIAVNPTSGNIYVVEAGRLDFDGDPSTPGQQSIVVFDQACNLLHHIPLPTTTANDVAYSNNALYVTDSNFAGAPTFTGTIYKVIDPDGGPGAPVSAWKTIPGAPNPIHAHAWKGPTDSAAVPYLFVATLGTQLVPSQPGHDGKLLRIRISDRQLTEYAGISGEFDGLGWMPGLPGPSLLLSDLSTRTVVKVNPTTGAVSPWADLSPYLRQTGGLASDGAIPATVAVASFRDRVLLVK